MSFKTYDADQVTISINGIPIDSGFADGEFLRIERDTEAFTDIVGTDGEVTRSKTNDNRARVTILLMQTASGNAALQALHILDKNTANGAGVGALQINDLNSSLTLYAAANAWIENEPSVSFDRPATTREWPIRVSNLIAVTGGN